MECTRQRLFIEIFAVLMKSLDDFTNDIDLCLQTITTQTIDKFSMCLSKGKNMHTKLINVAVDAVMAFIAVCTHFLYLKFVFISVCRLHSKHIYPEWHRANTAFSPLSFFVFFSFHMLQIICKLVLFIYGMSYKS